MLSNFLTCATIDGEVIIRWKGPNLFQIWKPKTQGG